MLPAAVLLVGCVPSGGGPHSPIPVEPILALAFLLRYWPIILAFIFAIMLFGASLLSTSPNGPFPFFSWCITSVSSLVASCVKCVFSNSHNSEYSQEGDSRKIERSTDQGDTDLNIGKISMILVLIILIVLGFVIPLLNSFRS